MVKHIDWEYVTGRLKKANLSCSSVDASLMRMKDIDSLRNEKNAVILAHYYQILPIQLLADFTGDSLALAQMAQTSDKVKNTDLIVSSTVHFMAEMIKLLNPDKKVVIPDLEASCSIAEGINGSTIRRMRQEFPNSAIVGYINTTAEAKAEMDCVCTSANADTIISRIRGDPIIMLPDNYFAQNIINKVNKVNSGIETRTYANAGKTIPKNYLVYKGIRDNQIVMLDVSKNAELKYDLDGAERPKLDKGTCIVHEAFTPEDVRLAKTKGMLVLAHPEVHPDVANEADMVGGTAKMIEYIKTTSAKKILYLTECDLSAPLIEAYPDREFTTPCSLCKYMKRNNLDNLMYSLKNEVHEVTLDRQTEIGARRSLEKMFELMRE